MDEAINPPENWRRFGSRKRLMGVPALLVLVLFLAFTLWNLYETNQQAPNVDGIPAHLDIEERFGIRILGVHLLARHGLVDLRYRVVDAGKAKNFGHYTETSPLLVAEDNGRKVEVTIMGLHNHRVETGRVYYILYRNTADALDPGSRVTVQLGDLSLQHVPVQ